MTRLNWLLMLAALTLLACPPPVDLPDGGNTIVVPKGGSGTFIREACSLIVPAGAFDDETVITVTRTTSGIPPVPDRTRVSDGCRLSPASLTSKVALTVIMTWDAGAVPPGVDVQSLDLRRQQGSEAYAQLPGTQVSLADAIIPFDRVTAQTDKLGVFWVTSPSQPNIDRVELSPSTLDLNVGDTGQLTARVVAPNGTTVTVPVEWSAAPPRVASVDENGLVTALDPGTATITVTIPDTNPPQTATAKVSVRGDTVGPVAFESDNAFPTNSDLHGGAFSPLGAVYAGGNGTVLLETPGGQWSRVASFPLVTFNAVGGTTMDNAVAVGQWLTPQGPVGLLVELKNGAPTSRTFSTLQLTDLRQLWFDGSSGLALGNGADNNALFYRDGGWQLDAPPSWQDTLSMLGDGAGDFTVVTNLGSIYRWNAQTRVWDSIYDQQLAVQLDAAQVMTPGGEAYAAGGSRFWHFDGSVWASENLPASPAFSRITALSVFDGYVFVAGEGAAPVTGRGLLLMRALTDTTWTSFELRGQQVPQRFFSQGTDARLVGTLGAVWKWTSASHSFAEVSHGFQGDVVGLALTAGELYAAVNECVDARCTSRSGAVMHRNGAGYAPLGTFPSAAPVVAIAARGDAELVVSTTSALHRWNGADWSTSAFHDPDGGVTSPGTLRALAWCGGQLFAAGDQGDLYVGSSTSLDYRATVSGGLPIASLSCAHGELWAAGTQVLATSADGFSWEAKSDPAVDSDWRAVWSPGAGEAITFGDRLFGGYWDTTTLSKLNADSYVSIDVGTALWGDQIDNLYLTGYARPELDAVGFLQRYDGISWRLVDPGSDKRGNALAGRSTNEIWLGTNGGGVLKAIAP